MLVDYDMIFTISDTISYTQRMKLAHLRVVQRVLHHPDFNADEVDHNMHERLMKPLEGSGRR